ncbi:MAG: TonB-dependent receptor [Gammaproteobacteria bacterium]|nr:TonB-dependent receptor [Gammaproteobacteria bacterium]
MFLVLLVQLLWPSLSHADILTTPIDELGYINLDSSALTRKPTAVQQTPAAVSVITAEQLRQHAVLTVPDALRLLPGVQVARIGANEWAVTSRGLGGRFARNMMVMLNGRSLFIPLFSGVNWDELGVAIEDIDRIEVVRGPGALLWGMNATNGMVHIITRKADQHQKSAAKLSAGSDLPGRMKATISGNDAEQGHPWYLSAMTEEYSGLSAESGISEGHWQQINLRGETQGEFASWWWQLEGQYTEIQDRGRWPVLHGMDVSDEDLNEKKRGGAVQLTAGRPLGGGELSQRTSFDIVKRSANSYNWNNHNSQFELQWARSDNGDLLIVGGGLYHSEEQITGDQGSIFTIAPDTQRVLRSSGYIEDIRALSDHWQTLIAGRYDYHQQLGNTFQPTVRLTYTPNNSTTLWAAWTRAESVPSRAVYDRASVVAADLNYPIDSNLTLPLLIVLNSDGQDRDNTKVESSELGYRFVKGHWNLDITAFSNQYSNLIAVDMMAADIQPQAGGLIISFPYVTNASGQSTGAEWQLRYYLQPALTLTWASDYLDLQVNSSSTNEWHDMAPITATVDDDFARSKASDQAPRWQHRLMAAWLPASNWFATLTGRYVSAISPPSISSYYNLDASLGWDLTTELTVALLAHNLLGPSQRVESVSEVFYVDAFRDERSLRLDVEYRF